MQLEDFIANYNLHDSLLEECIYAKEEGKLTLLIDFCYWAQSAYKDGEAETGLVTVIFYDVSAFKRDDYEINSDAIIGIRQSMPGQVELVVQCDDRSIHLFSFYTSAVEICTDSSMR